MAISVSFSSNVNCAPTRIDGTRCSRTHLWELRFLTKTNISLRPIQPFRLWSVTPKMNLKKITPLDITPANERETNRILFNELQQGKRQHFELVKRLQRKDGQLIWIQLYVFRIADRAATGQHTFGMNFDITEKMQAQDALQAAQAELARSAHVSRMGAMTASIAHEVNQPLAAVVGFGSAGLRWLEQTPPAIDKARECLKSIVRAGHTAKPTTAARG